MKSFRLPIAQVSAAIIFLVAALGRPADSRPGSAAAVSAPASKGAASKPASRSAEDDPRRAALLKEATSRVLAWTNDGPFKGSDLLEYLKAKTLVTAAEGTAESKMLSPPDLLKNAARLIIAQREIYRAFMSGGTAIPQDIRDEMAQSAALEVMTRVFQEIDKSVQAASEAEARKYFESNQVQFRKPLKFWMRHLALLTYVPVVSKQGDTLESIAAQVSGSEKNVDRILTDAEIKVARWVAPADRERRPFMPLKEGERLLVPMSPKDAEEARTLLETKILPKLKEEGEDFAKLCARYSEAEDKGEEIGPLPFGTTPMLAEILQAGRTQPVGEVGPIIRSKHGFEVVQVTKREDEHQPAFDEVHDTVVQKIRETRLKQRRADVEKDLWTRAKLDLKALADPKRPDTAIVASTRTRKWTKEEIKKSLGTPLENIKDDDGLIAALRSGSAVQHYLAVEYGEDRGYFKDTAFAKRVRLLNEGVLAQSLLKKTMEDAKAGVSDRVARQWYESHKERFAPPRKYAARQIAANLDPKADLEDPAQRAKAEEAAFAKLRKAVEGVKTKEDFAAAAMKNSQDSASAGQGGSLGEIQPGLERPGKFAEALKDLPEGKVSEPFVDGNIAYVVWIDKIVSGQPEPYEKVKPAVVQLAGNEAEFKAGNEMIDKALKNAGYRPGEVPAAPVKK